MKPFKNFIDIDICMGVYLFVSRITMGVLKWKGIRVEN